MYKQFIVRLLLILSLMHMQTGAAQVDVPSILASGVAGIALGAGFTYWYNEGHDNDEALVAQAAHYIDLVQKYQEEIALVGNGSYTPERLLEQFAHQLIINNYSLDTYKHELDKTIKKVKEEKQLLALKITAWGNGQKKSHLIDQAAKTLDVLHKTLPELEKVQMIMQQEYGYLQLKSLAHKNYTATYARELTLYQRYTEKRISKEEYLKELSHGVLNHGTNPNTAYPFIAAFVKVDTDLGKLQSALEELHKQKNFNLRPEHQQLYQQTIVMLRALEGYKESIATSHDYIHDRHARENSEFNRKVAEETLIITQKLTAAQEREAIAREKEATARVAQLIEQQNNNNLIARQQRIDQEKLAQRIYFEPEIQSLKDAIKHDQQEFMQKKQKLEQELKTLRAKLEAMIRTTKNLRTEKLATVYKTITALEQQLKNPPFNPTADADTAQFLGRIQAYSNEIKKIISEDCSICLEQIEPGSDDSFVTECNQAGTYGNHEFHRSCLQKYSTESGSTKCPNCRGSIENSNKL